MGCAPGRVGGAAPVNKGLLIEHTFDTVSGMTPEEETQVLAGGAAHGLTLTQVAEHEWTTIGDDPPAPSFPTKQYALTWLSNRIGALELARRGAHPSSGLAARYGRPGGVRVADTTFGST